MPDRPNASSEPNDGSSTTVKAQAVPGGAMRWTYTSSRPEARARSVNACRAPWWVTTDRRTPAPSARCCHRSATALIATGKPSSRAAATVSAGLVARRNGSTSMP